MSVLENPNEFRIRSDAIRPAPDAKLEEAMESSLPYGVKFVFQTCKSVSRSQAANFVVQNPGTAGLCAVAGVATGVALAPGAVAGVALPVMGFTESGVAAGSAAAAWHATIGNAVAPSAFATLQSAAAGGYGVTAVSSAISAGAGAIGVTAAGEAVRRAWLGKKREKREEKEDKEEKKGNDEDDENEQQ